MEFLAGTDYHTGESQHHDFVTRQSCPTANETLRPCVVPTLAHSAAELDLACVIGHYLDSPQRKS